MRKTVLVIGLIATTAAAPTLAFANCHQRRVTGTIAGGLGGGLIGAAAASAPWGFLAAGLGALTGNVLAGSTCHEGYRHYYRSAYYRRGYYHYGYYHHGYY